MHGLLASLARRPGGRAPQSLSPRIIRTLNAADAPEPRWTTERLSRRLLDFIDRRLLECGLNQDDEVHDPRLPSQGDRGSCTAVKRTVEPGDACVWISQEVPAALSLC